MLAEGASETSVRSGQGCPRLDIPGFTGFEQPISGHVWTPQPRRRDLGESVFRKPYFKAYFINFIKTLHDSFSRTSEECVCFTYVLFHIALQTARWEKKEGRRCPCSLLIRTHQKRCTAALWTTGNGTSVRRMEWQRGAFTDWPQLLFHINQCYSCRGRWKSQEWRSEIEPGRNRGGEVGRPVCFCLCFSLSISLAINYINFPKVKPGFPLLVSGKQSPCLYFDSNQLLSSIVIWTLLGWLRDLTGLKTG